MDTTTEKLNKALGITDNESIDDVIAGFDEELETIKNNMDTSVEKIDNSVAINDIHSMKDTFSELSELIGSAKSMLVDVHTYVSQSEILDPDVLKSGADLIKASREVIAEYLEVYKDKMKHFHNIEMEMLKFDNKKKLEKYKHDLKSENKDVDDGEYVSYIQEDVIQAMNVLDKTKHI